MESNPVVIITGAAKRIGAQLAKTVHAAGYNVLVHYNSSEQAALALTDTLNTQRPNSAMAYQLDLQQTEDLPKLTQAAVDKWQRIDALINNASNFYPTPLAKLDQSAWDDLINSNLKGPVFLSKAVAPFLAQTNGCIVNFVDIHAQSPLNQHSAYCISKAGLVAATMSLAKDLAPVRVNAIAPGPILWPDDITDERKESVTAKTLLKRNGTTEEIAKAALFLIRDATYTTGHVLVVDGGCSLT